VPAWHWQADEVVLFATDNVREGHAQHPGEVAIAAELKWSAGHPYATHAALPEAALNVPAGHAVQAVPSLPVKPAMHVQLLMLKAPCSEDEPTGQIEHGAKPGAVLYVPAAHSVHTPPFAPVYPALHWHAPAETLPAGESELRGQLAHCAGPGISLNVPGTHAVQFEPPLPVKPAMHVQLLMLVLPSCSEDEPTGQIEQFADPGADWKLPGAHCAHVRSVSTPALMRLRTAAISVALRRASTA